MEERDKSKSNLEAQRTWKTWSEGKEITEDVESTMNPFIGALDQIHPEWDDNKILDEAYRMAKFKLNPDGNAKEIASKVLTEADEARKANPPKITPKSTVKPDSEKSYSELLSGQ